MTRKGVYVDKTAEMERLLVKEGLPAAEVAKQTGVSKRRVFEFAGSRNLPTNPPIRPGSTRERQFCRAITSLMAGVVSAKKSDRKNLDAALDSIAPSFGLSPGGVRRVIANIDASMGVISPSVPVR